MAMGMFEFGTVLLLTLGLGLLLSGVFTAYFGRGKSRKVGMALTIIGVLIWIGTYMGHYEGFLGDTGFMDIVMTGLFYVGSFIIGALIALGIFLVAIMKT
ncbi:MAG: hypothetical protein KGY76_05685 [Candidatus Thermoplasmatota archaeon]|nr:hypothetical protein [Candidatus Thermoplasmatota archaeon]